LKLLVLKIKRIFISEIERNIWLKRLCSDRGTALLKLDNIPLFTDVAGITMRVLEANQ
jgi:hypothetical protein